MMNLFRSFVSVLLVLTVLFSSLLSVSAQSASDDEPSIVSTDMTLQEAENNTEKYLSTNEEMTEKYPDGLYVIEYNSYGIYEGGADPENPEDVYLGMNVYRLGGYSSYAEVTFAVSPVVADAEVYPVSQGIIEFEPQQRVGTAKVKIHNDDVRRGDQILMVSLISASAGVISEGASAVITITDDEPYVESIVGISVSKAVTDVNEGCVTVTLKRTNTTAEYCTMVLKTSDGTAKAGVDYTHTETEVMFSPGKTEQTVRIPLIQSDSLYSDTKYFNVELCNLAACQVDGESKIRVEITNNVKDGASKLTVVSGKADIETDYSSVITNTPEPVININDNINRKQLLMSAVGAANGTAVQAVPEVNLMSSSGKWESTVVLSPKDFETTYSTASDWEPNKKYSNGNENVFIATKEPLDLNLFDRILFKYKNDEWGANGNPNTAAGYTKKPVRESEDFFFTKSSLDHCSEEDREWMESEGVYFLVDDNNKNVDRLSEGMSKFLYSLTTVKRYPETAGMSGENQHIFYMLYDDQGWDDHHFEMGDTVLYRAIVPFSVFESEYIDEGSFKATSSGVSFNMDGYKWTITAPDIFNGGVGECDYDAPYDKDKYGFYLGSRLKVEYRILSEESIVPTPKELSLVDDEGVVHNVATKSDTESAFWVNLNTLLTNNVSQLKTQYGMTKEEADKHAAIVQNENGCISSIFPSKLSFKAEYVMQQNVVLDFSNVPQLAKPIVNENGEIESESVRRQRVMSVLDDVISFYDLSGNEITPEPQSVDMSRNFISYPTMDFDYIRVSPTSAGPDMMATSNLYDLDYKNIDKAVEITDETCFQIDDSVTFTLYSKGTTYLKPQLSLNSTMISERQKDSNDFTTTYVANKLDSFIPFEYLYSDRGSAPIPSYYTMKVNISRIYLDGAEASAEKKFKVNVNRTKSNGQETELLFNFDFIGGQNVTDEILVDTYNLSEKFDLKSQGISDFDPYKPVVKLMSFSDSGYEYIIYIPSAYNYQLEAQGSEDTRYTTIFQGGDGVSIELEDYEKDTHIEGDVEEESVVISYLDINDTQYICPKTPSVVSENGGASVETPYFEEQNQFPTYTDNNVVVGLSGMSVDATNTGLFLSTIFKKLATDKNNPRWGTASKVAAMLAGSTAYCKFNNQQIVLGAKLSIGYGNTDAIAVGETTTNEKSEYFGALFDEPKVSSDATHYKTKYNPGVLKIAGAGAFEGSIQLDYSHIYHRFQFTKVTMSVSGNFAVSGVIPIAPTGGIVYATITTSLGCAFSVSYNQVLNYVDKEGVAHYASYWSDFILTPSVYVSAGFGVGISGVIAFEGSIALAVSFSVNFGAAKFSASQQEFDVTTRPTDNDNAKFKNYKTTSTFDGNWQYYDMDIETHGETMYQDYYFGDTKCESNVVGDTLTITSIGTSFHLTGIRNSKGGIAKVTVYNTKTNELIDSALVNTYSENEKRYQTLYYWQMKDYESAPPVPFKVVIEHIENDDTLGNKIALDSFRVFNTAFYKEELMDAAVTSAVVKLSLSLKFVLGPFDIVIEPGYMQIVRAPSKDSITLGTIGYYKTYEVPRTLAQNEDIPVLMATAYVPQEVSDIDYFDTGEYGQQKQLSTLANNVEHTSKTQVINHTRELNGSLVASDYAFYSKLVKNSDTDEAEYSLYYAVDGVEQGTVTDDVFVSDFFAFEDEEGKLNVALIANDSTISSITGKAGDVITLNFADGTKKEISKAEDISLILKANCVKIAVFDNDNNITIKSVGATSGNNKQENRPVAASYPSGNTVLFYTEDEPTDFKAEYDMNFVGFSDGLNESVRDVEALMNAAYSGRCRIYSAVKNSSGEFASPVAMDLENLIGAEKFKTGFRITSMDAIMKDENTICLAFAAETPYVYADKENIEGTLKEIYYCTGKVSGDKVDFSSVIIVDSVLDYKEDISELGFDVSELSEKYYNKETGDVYDDIILSNVQFENAVVGENKTVVSADKVEPVLFFHTNSSINCVNYSTLNGVINKDENSKLAVNVLYNGNFDDYVIAADENGAVSLIYNDTTESGAYTDTLYVLNYDAQHSVWNRPRRLTYSEAFDKVNFENKTETSALIFDNLSAYVDENGKIAVALRSSYLPFSYDYGVSQKDMDTDFYVNMDEADKLYTDENNESKPVIVTPVLDYDSENARTDIALLTFEKPVTDFDVKNFILDNDIFIEGSEIEAVFNLVNTGDTVVEGLKAAFYYYDLESNTISPEFGVKNLTEKFIAGHSEPVMLSYTVDEAPDNQLLCVRITNSSGRTVYYDSYKDSYLAKSENITYQKINRSAEFVISANKVEIDSNGIMNFSTEVSNIGEIDAFNDVVVSCNYYDDSIDNKFKGTLFSFTIEAEELLSGASVAYQNDFDVSDKLKDNKLYYSFEISAVDSQYNTENDKTNVACAEQIPELETNSIRLASYNTTNNISTDGHRIFDVALGDVVEIKNDVISGYFKKSDIRAYEIGSACLSVDNSAQNGNIRIKITDVPENGEYVKLLLNIRGTTIYRYVYLNITNSDTINLDTFYTEEGWNMSGQKHLYAKDYDVISTEADGSQMNFSFVGKDLRLYGDFLKSGGSFEITIFDRNGNEVEKKLVDTKSEFNDYGMLMFVSKGLDFGRYNVSIKAVLDEGEKLSLDHIKYTIDVTGADTSPYPDANSYTQELDAPLINGRQRQAIFRLNFNKEIKLAEGKNLSDVTLTFDEYEKNSDGTYTATGNKAIFTAEEIMNGKTLVFTSVLSGKAGCVLKYMLADSEIADGYFIGTDGRAASTDIPDYDMVSYIVKESGILSVTVVEDEKMPQGNVHSRVEVKFASVADTSRLEGTKLLYKTVGSDFAETDIEFEYAGMTDDPRTAVYRADSLTLDKNELEKTFSFYEGIVLNQDNYVLVTADGDYLENDLTSIITDKSDVDILYSKTKAEDTYINVVSTENGVCPEVVVRFNNPVNADYALNNAFVTVTRTVTDAKGQASEDIILEAKSLTDNYTMVFAGDKTFELSGDAVVEYALKNNIIESAAESTGIVNAYDGIEVSPNLVSSETVKFSSEAYIVRVKPYFESGKYQRESNALCAEVEFSTLMSEQTLKSSELAVKEYTKSHTEELSRILNLTFAGAENVSQNGKTVTVATYKYISDNDDITLKRGEVAKRFIPVQQLTLNGNDLTTADGKLCYPFVLNRDVLEVGRLSASSAKLNLVSNNDMGYNLELLVSFDEEIELITDDNDAFAGVDMVNGSNEAVPITLNLIKETDNTLHFVTKQPFYLNADEVTTFTLHDCFYDIYEFIVDSEGIGVSENIKGLATLVSDMTDVGVVTSVYTDIVNINGEGAAVVAEVTYDSKLSQASFEKSQINALQKILFEDSQVSNVDTVLTFKEIKNEYTAVYTATLSVPDNAVAAEVILDDCIKVHNSAQLLNDIRTLSLSTELNEKSKAKISKAEAVVASIISDVNVIKGFDDIYIGVTYSEKIAADNLEGITLDVNVKGVDGVSSVLYRAKQVVNDNTLVFVSDEIVSAKLANVIELSLKDAKLNLSENSEVYSVSTSLKVMSTVPDVTQEFITDSAGDVVIPTTSAEAETTTAEVTESASVTTEPITIPAPDTQLATGNTDIDTENGDVVATGVALQVWCMAAALVALAALSIVLISKKQSQK